jgi:putative membrane protein
MPNRRDPRVFFAAERTLMAWNRTGLALMAFGFVLERFGVFLHVMRQDAAPSGRDLSFWIGIAFIVLALSAIAFSIVQFRRVLKTLGLRKCPSAMRPGAAWSRASWSSRWGLWCSFLSVFRVVGRFGCRKTKKKSRARPGFC